MAEIRKVGVIGAGVMGAGHRRPGRQCRRAGRAARHRAEGVPIAERGRRRRGREDAARPIPRRSCHAQAAKLVRTGNIEDDLGLLAECDWIIEAVVERLDIKQALYRKLDAVRRPGTAVSSNTSTIPLAALVGDMPEAFARDFLITHFFNPPRYMRLLELVDRAEDRSGARRSRSPRFADVTLGKSIVRCKDTPGFIANRIGTLLAAARRHRGDRSGRRRSRRRTP